MFVTVRASSDRAEGSLYELAQLLAFGIVLLAGCGASSPPRSGECNVRDDFEVIGYFESGSIEEIPWDSLTHVNFAFAIPNPDGTLAPLARADVLGVLAAVAHSHQVSVSLAVGGWMDGDDSAFHALAEHTESRARFAQELRRAVQEYGLDGVDIDWEYPERDAAEPFDRLIREVRDAIGPGRRLTAAVGRTPQLSPGVQARSVEVLDAIGIMAYDAQGPEHSSVSQAVDALEQWSAHGVPTRKMRLGLPLYSRPSYLSYAALVARNADDAFRDEADGENYNGLPTLLEKTRLAHSRIGGVMIWELGLDAPAEQSAVRAIAGSLGP